MKCCYPPVVGPQTTDASALHRAQRGTRRTRPCWGAIDCYMLMVAMGRSVIFTDGVVTGGLVGKRMVSGRVRVITG